VIGAEEQPDDITWSSRVSLTKKSLEQKTKNKV